MKDGSQRIERGFVFQHRPFRYPGEGGGTWLILRRNKIKWKCGWGWVYERGLGGGQAWGKEKERVAELEKGSNLKGTQSHKMAPRFQGRALLGGGRKRVLKSARAEKMSTVRRGEGNDLERDKK